MRSLKILAPAWLLCFAMIISVAAFTFGCTSEAPPPNVPDIPNTPTTPDNPETEDKTVYVFKDGATEYSLVHTGKNTADYTYARTIFNKLAIDFAYESTDIYDFKTKTSDKEILIGETDRQISKDLKSAADAKNTSGKDFVWGFGYRDGKLAFYANSTEAFEYGWEAFFNTVVHDDGIYFDGELWVIGCKTYLEYQIENKTLFRGKTISFLGDSITSFAGYSTAGNETYYGGYVTYLKAEDTYWMRTVENYGMRLGVNDGWSGSRIGWDGVTASGNMVGKDKNMASQKRIDTLDDNGVPDFIVVYAGTNDIRREPLGSLDEVDWDTVLDYENTTPAERAEWRVDDFAHSTASMLAGLKMTYPDAHILVLIPTWVEVNSAHEYTASAEIVKERTNAFGDLYIEVCKKFGVDYIDLRAICDFEDRATSGFYGDAPSYLHPSASGMNEIFLLMKDYYDKLVPEALKTQ